MENRLVKILSIVSDESDLAVLAQFIHEEQLPYEYLVARSVAEVRSLIPFPDVDIIIADYKLTDGDLLDLLDLIVGKPLILTTAGGNKNLAAEVMKTGACDYLVKDPRGSYLQTLPSLIVQAIKRSKAEKSLAKQRCSPDISMQKQSAALEAVALDRQRTAAALHTSEKHLRSILESAAGFAVFRLTLVEIKPFRAKVDFISPSIKEITGIGPEKCSPAQFKKIVHPDDLERVVEANREAMETTRFNEICRVYHPAKMEWIWVQVMSTGVRDDSGNITHINGIFIDVTEKQTAREELKQKARDLENANLALNALLKNRKEAKATLENNIRANMNNLVFPSLERVLQTRLNDHQKNHLEIVHASLKELMSSFSRKMSTLFLSLSPTEIEVANLIRHGKSVKEIAAILNISTVTARNHRQKVREKVGLKNTKVNLRTYLLSLE